MATNSSSSPEDAFQLFDLRVEVVCPPGKRIMCGAKEGDYFTLKGEMLYLPPDQGISIYSLCTRTPTHSYSRVAIADSRKQHRCYPYSLQSNE
ncbi:hypothetical protein HER10_EVM0006276 [Colletotrichum scovillei]|uniref:uncharacterized protein n=1 Tax=Colletotrichum scovillei TaxID=1209932 RepID=UPI0015C2D0FD|nr:uncharacterized protein HER10_EVM0006276 [Colletotrichum scovillei]KAF4779745.1 hypothetical protein HER10_EVM0006276 [Colletotrichum scovillei]